MYKNSLRRFFNTLFGTLNWQKPQWMGQAKTAPLRFWSITALFTVLAINLGYAYYWYKNQPKPVYTVASIKVPDTTPLSDNLIPNNLIIDFGTQGKESQPVAPLNQVGKNVEVGIEISPKIKGHWYWNSDSELIFYPEEDWPAEQTYNITFAPDALNKDAKLEKQTVSFTTHSFNANIKEFKFYQNPTDPTDRKAVATIEFNFPVDSQSLEKNTKLQFQSLKNQQGAPVTYSYTYDSNKRVAYLQSQNIEIQDVARYLKLMLNKEIMSSTHSGQLKQVVSQNLLIPDSSNFLTIGDVKASIVRNDKDRPEQVLTIESSIGVSEAEINRSVHVYLLPQDYPATAAENVKKNYTWSNPGEVTKAILDISTPLTKEALPTETNYSTLHSYKFDSQTPRFLYITVDQGMKGFGGFKLNKNYATVVAVPEYPKEISFLHKGSLLALGSDQRLSVVVRGLPAVKFEFARVLPENVNQLVTQTDGDFNNPYFINPSFNQQNISQISSEIQNFNATDMSKSQYSALDLNKYIGTETNSNGPRGLFLLQATGWDTTNNSALDARASRLILVTDLAMIVKDNQEGSHDVFVQSITNGAPVASANVSVLGKNGLAILSRTTDANGQANFPSLNDFTDDRQPTAYIASLNQDVSFIPYNKGSRQLNFSKYDVGGLYSYYQQDYNSLSAFLFSDRGIYRPGDSVHIGMIVKQAFAKPQPAGIPVEVTVVDARGNTIKDEKIALNDTGFMSLDFSTLPTSPTGFYNISMFLVKDNLAQNLIGSTTIKVSEFLPDRMKINAELIPHPTDGWISPNGLKAKVNLWNLYGAPAMDRKVSARMVLTPQQVSFDKYPDYVFADPLFDPKKPPKTFDEFLKDATTNTQGEVEFNLGLERFEQATYQLTFFAEGFEAQGGRSVTTQTKTLISPLPYFVGYKADGDLAFIKQKSSRSVNYIAVNPQLGTNDVNDLKIQLVSLLPVTSLVKKPDGTYQYQSIIQSKVLDTKPFTIATQGTTYALPTQDIGDFALNVVDNKERTLSQLKFSVVGESSQPLAKNAELSIKLDKTNYQAGDTINLQITSPYTGSGLITIERDKVYASQWFKTDNTNSVQTITIPADFQGNGYINVAFTRDWNSSEIFMNPLSYSIEPFSVSYDKQTIHIDLKAPQTAKPGEPLVIDYSADKPSSIVIFAVDEGILQVARYATPNPLAFFFQKRALEVLTQQTIDQILPKFILDRELSATGGDEGEGALAGRLNPFKRKTDLPVVFWSGIITADQTSKQVSYNVPDYFNGSLQIMAVAVSPDAMGSSEIHSTIKGDFVINPNAPTFVAPGDTFEVSASVANNVKNSGDHSQVSIELAASPGIEIIDSKQQQMEIPEGQEKAVQFKLKATQDLGSARLTFRASSGSKTSSMDATLSVRPASPYKTTMQAGQSNKATVSLKLQPNFYKEFYKSQATLSASPLILVLGLEQFLSEYPYGCTEQVTSKAMPLIAMKAQAWFQGDMAALDSKVNMAIASISQRQMSNGGFTYWPGSGSNYDNAFASVYAMHFLTEARGEGFTVGTDTFSNGLGYLKDLASQNPQDMDTARIQAYAIYLLTRNEIVTTNYITNLLQYFEKNKVVDWKQDIAAVYIAASYQLLKNSDDANQLINQFKLIKSKQASDFYNDSLRDAQYLYLIAKHFPNRLDEVNAVVVPTLVQNMNDNQYNTILSGYTSLALGAFSAPMLANGPSYSVTTYDDKQQKQNIAANQSGYQEVTLAQNITQVDLNNPKQELLFYTLLQNGFDKSPVTAPTSQGVEITREIRNASGSVVTTAKLGEELEVHIQVRATENHYLTNMVIEDLLPGGFEVVTDSVKSDYLEYFDIREDRINFFLTIDERAREIVYKIKATNPGSYIIPAIYVESMYNPSTRASGTTSQFEVK